MKRLITIAIVLTCVEVSLSQSLHSVNLFTSYSTAGGKRFAVADAHAYGGGAEVRFNIVEKFSVSIGGGYESYSIAQDSALQHWNWDFWIYRYEGIVKDNLKSDSSLAATLEAVQTMDVFPLYVAVNYEIAPLDNVCITPFAGGGFLFYTRKLYLNEDWRKRFDAVNYTFEYSYRNFASYKTGNPWFLFFGVDAGYKLSEIFMLNAALRSSVVLKSKARFGYDDFPFRNTLLIKMGISIVY